MKNLEELFPEKITTSNIDDAIWAAREAGYIEIGMRPLIMRIVVAFALANTPYSDTEHIRIITKGHIDELFGVSLFCL